MAHAKPCIDTSSSLEDPSGPGASGSRRNSPSPGVLKKSLSKQSLQIIAQAEEAAASVEGDDRVQTPFGSYVQDARFGRRSNEEFDEVPQHP